MDALESIVRYLTERGTLVQPDALDYLSRLDDPVEKLKAGFAKGHEVPFVLTVDHARRLTGEVAVRPPTERTNDGAGGQATQLEPPRATPRQVAPERPRPTQTPQAVPRVVIEPQPVPPDVAGPSAVRPVTHPAPPRQEATVQAPRVRPVQPEAPRFSDQVQAVADEVSVLLDVTGESTCEGTLDDFAKLFRDRYNRMRRLFRTRREMVGATAINRMREGQPVKFIGIVTDVKTTKNGHRILEIEDETGSATVLASNKESRLLELADTLILDEIVGVSGKLAPRRGGRDGLVILDEIVRPEVPLDHKARAGGRGKALVLSDVHVGADTFLHEGWEGVIDWLSGKLSDHADVARQVRYVVINGDLVEGVGIYPGQEKELHIPDVFDQYKEAADALARLPEHLKVIALPGNHDAVRPAEPQPAFPEPIRELFSPNVRLLGNPCTVSLSGIELLCYHGVSLFDYIEALPNCSINKPVETMVEMLRRRHLCPTYGGKTPLAPEHRDYMAIERIPDLFITGHVHAAQTGEYRGVKLVNASTWQEQTDYQRMMGFTPDPCKAFVVDLATMDLTTYAFDHDEGTNAVRVEPADVSVRVTGAIQ